jgi:hypothetical protein
MMAKKKSKATKSRKATHEFRKSPKASKDKPGRKAREAQKKRKAVATKKSKREPAAPPAMPQAMSAVFVSRPTNEIYAHAKQVYDAHKNDLKALDKRIQFVSLGARYKAGQPTGEIAIRLNFQTQEEKEAFRAEAVAGKIGLQQYYEGVPIDLTAWNFKPAQTHMADGDLIVSGGGSGTLATTVEISGNPAWLTAGHVVSPTRKLTAKSSVKDGAGNVIGSVPANDQFYVRNGKADAAVIVPMTPISASVPGRIARRLTGNDVGPGKTVSMHGAVSQTVGHIDSIDHTEVQLSDGIKVTDHIFVLGSNGVPFGRPGDSGSLVKMGSDIVGIIRATDFANNVTVVCQIMNVIGKLGISF